jgi:hypothetical protein
LFFLDRITGFLVGSPLQTGGGRGFFVLQVFSEVVGFKDVGLRAFSGDPKGKSELISRGEK